MRPVKVLNQEVAGSLFPDTLICALAFTLLTACTDIPKPDGPPLEPINVSIIPDAVPRVEPPSRYGNPPSYVVNGERYFTRMTSQGYTDRGIASWYGTKFHGRRTSSGEPYDMYLMTAAHRTLPLPTYLEVTNLANDKRTVVRVNDRGPFHPDRVLDLSYAAAVKLGIVETGTAEVTVRAIDPIRTDSLPSRDDGEPVVAVEGVRGVYVQAGAFRSLANAEHLRLRVQSHVAAEASLTEVSRGDESLFRVRIGPIRTVAEAQGLATRLIAAGISDPRIVKEH